MLDEDDDDDDHEDHDDRGVCWMQQLLEDNYRVSSSSNEAPVEQRLSRQNQKKLMTDHLSWSRFSNEPL